MVIVPLCSTAGTETATDATEKCVENSGDSQTWTLNIATAGTIDNGTVQVEFDLYHSYKGDVTITLQSPEGTTRTIKTGSSGGGDDYGDADGTTYNGTYTIKDGIGGGTLDDTGDDLPGNYDPAQAFSSFDGEDPQGNWTLTFSDGANSDDGCIRNVELTMDVTPNCTSPTITAHPSADSECAGDNAIFTASATGASTYKWQENTGSWANITDGGVYSGSTTTTLTLTGVTSSMVGYDYRMVAIDATGDCTTNTNSAELTVKGAVTTQPSEQAAATTGTATFTVVANGSPTYQWQESTNEGSSWANISNGGVYSNATTASLSITSPGIGYDGYDYRVITTGSGCSSDNTSNSANLIIGYGTKSGGDGTWEDNDQWAEGAPPADGSKVIILHNTTTTTTHSPGELIINSGVSLSLGSMSADFTVQGDLTIDGTLTLSSNSSSDLYVEGNWTNNGTFTHNSRIVHFQGTQDPQTITKSGGNLFTNSRCPNLREMSS